jgi:aspartate/methionine/tyrosine aminotransferase
LESVVPSYPHFADKLAPIQGAIFEKYRKQMDVYGPDMVHLHIGDSYRRPVYSLPLKKEFVQNHTNFNRYCNTFGIDQLRHELRDKLREDNALEVNDNNLLITVGATNALSASIHSIMNPQEEILLLTPCWPIFPGIVKAAAANLVEVPFYNLLYSDANLDIAVYLDRYVTAKTVAIYLNSPNNPSGKVLNEFQLKQIADFACHHNLWVLSDEAYDGLLFDNRHHTSIASLPNMFSRTISVFTFSKIFMFAGLRLGWAAANSEAIINLNKILVHQLYGAPTITQQMMVEPIKTRHTWMAGVKDHYQELRDIMYARLDLPIKKPEATYFMFFSICDYLNGRDYNDVIETCFSQGVSVAPGADFGRDYHEYIRICFTGEPPEKLERGILKLREILI